MTTIYCNKKSCQFNRSIPEKHFISEDNLLDSHFEEDAYTGVCDRDKVFVGSKEITTSLVHHDLAVCKNFSKLATSVMDFSKLPQGGHIDADYGRKMKKDNEVTKSYPDHLREGKG